MVKLIQVHYELNRILTFKRVTSSILTLSTVNATEEDTYCDGMPRNQELREKLRDKKRGSERGDTSEENTSTGGGGGGRGGSGESKNPKPWDDDDFSFEEEKS